MTRWSMPALLALVEKSLFNRRPRSAQQSRLTKLQFDPLEDRVVLDAVAPGTTWDDGTWQRWGKVGGTVSVSNTGSSWLEVNRNGNGAVTVAPGVQPANFDDDDYYPYRPQMTNYKSYSFSVNGYSSNGSGDVVWSGAADSLSINATGDVSSISIDGTLYVHAGETIGNLSGRTVWATAGKSIGNVSASDYVGTLMAGTSIGKVSSANSISQITAGQSIGDVTAGGNITSIYAKENTGSISAGAWLGAVQAGLDIGGSVSAGLWIGGAYIPGTDSNDYWAWQYANYGNGISAGRDILGSVTAGKGIKGVSAGRHILGSITASDGDIWWVHAGGGGVSSTNSNPDYYEYDEMSDWEPYAPGRIVGTVKASRDIYAVSATGNVEGSVTAQSGYVLGVNAGEDILGNVTAQTDIGRSAYREEVNDWRPFGYYWTNPFWYGYGTYLPHGTGVRAGGEVIGNIKATQGDVSTVTAGTAILGAVDAGRDVVNVAASDDVRGKITAGRDVLSVTAGGYVSEDTYDDESFGQPGHISNVSGAISASRDIGYVSATGDLTEKIEAGHGIHEVRAGGNISSSIIAGAGVGSLEDSDPRLPKHHPYQYYYDNTYGSGIVKAGGNFTGSIKAGTDVSRVEAQGTVSGTVDAKRDIGFVQGALGVSSTITAGRDLGRVYSGGYGYSYNSSWWSWYPTWGELQNAPSGDFNGSISVVGDVYGVFATGNVSGPVTAGCGIADVSAKKSVTGDIYAGNSIGYLGDLISDVVNFNDDDSEYYEARYYGGGIYAKENVDAKISAEGDVTRIRADHDVTGDILVGRDVRTSVSAGNSVIGDVIVHRNIAAVIADQDDVIGVVAAEGSIGQVIAAHDISGDVQSGIDIDTIISGLNKQGGIISGDISAGRKIQKIWALGEGESSQIPFEFSDPASSTFVWNWGAWSSQLTTDQATGDSYTAHWASTSIPTRPTRPQLGTGGDITGKVTAVGDIGEVRAFGEITNDISGKTIPAGVWAYEKISGNITSRTGTAEVMSWGEISGNVSVVGANVRAYGDISGDVSGGTGMATVISWEDARGNTDATGNVVVRALNNVGKDGYQEAAGDKKITSSTGKAEVWAGKDVATPVKAKGFVGVYAVQSVEKTSGANSNEDEVWVQSETGDIAGGDYAGKLGANLTSGRDIGKEGSSVSANSSAGYISIDAGGGVYVSNATGKTDVWVAARSGNLSGNFTSTDSWLYAWSKVNLEGELTAQQMVSASAWGDIKANIKSESDGVEAITDAKFNGKITGAKWVTVDARGNIDGEIKAGVAEEFGEASIRSGGDINAKVVSSGDAELSASGSVTGRATATRGWLNVSAGETIYGDYVSYKWLSIWSGGTVAASASSVGDVEIETGGAVLPMGDGFRSTLGEVWVNGVELTSDEVSDKEQEKVADKAEILMDTKAYLSRKLVTYIGKFAIPAISEGLDVHTKVSIKWETYRGTGETRTKVSEGEYTVWLKGRDVVDSLRKSSLKINLSPKDGGHYGEGKKIEGYPYIEEGEFDKFVQENIEAIGTSGWLTFVVETKGYSIIQKNNYLPKIDGEQTGPTEKPVDMIHAKNLKGPKVSVRPNRIREMGKVDEDVDNNGQKIIKLHLRNHLREQTDWSLVKPAFWNEESKYKNTVTAKIEWDRPLKAEFPMIKKELK